MGEEAGGSMFHSVEEDDEDLSSAAMMLLPRLQRKHTGTQL